jgi:predicted HTH domain antitoxin
MRVTLEIPDELAAVLGDEGQDLSRAALEAIGLEAYRQGRLSGYQLRTLLGIPSRFELEAFLKERQVYDYTVEDFEKDLANVRSSREIPKVNKSA